jgi:hypothetical protein
LPNLLGLEGISLLDACAGDCDREFTDARLAEIRQLLRAAPLRGTSSSRMYATSL